VEAHLEEDHWEEKARSCEDRLCMYTISRTLYIYHNLVAVCHMACASSDTGRSSWNISAVNVREEDASFSWVER
jgi:hypothetical protein